MNTRKHKKLIYTIICTIKVTLKQGKVSDSGRSVFFYILISMLAYGKKCIEKILIPELKGSTFMQNFTFWTLIHIS